MFKFLIYIIYTQLRLLEIQRNDAIQKTFNKYISIGDSVCRYQNRFSVPKIIENAIFKQRYQCYRFPVEFTKNGSKHHFSVQLNYRNHLSLITVWNFFFLLLEQRARYHDVDCLNVGFSVQYSRLVHRSLWQTVEMHRLNCYEFLNILQTFEECEARDHRSCAF